MKDFLKKNLTTLIIVGATLVLAGIAIFTAIRLYQLKQSPVAPNVPSSEPKAAAPVAACSLSFTITVTTPTPTPVVTTTPTPTPVPQCNSSCTTDSDCPSSMICYVGACRNPSCTTTNTCVCATATPTPTATATSTPAPTITSSPAPSATPTLPTSGNIEPTILGISAGAILLVLSLALVL